MSTVALIFPHQLFADHPALARDPALVVLVEDTLPDPFMIHQQRRLDGRRPVLLQQRHLTRWTRHRGMRDGRSGGMTVTGRD